MRSTWKYRIIVFSISLSLLLVPSTVQAAFQQSQKQRQAQTSAPTEDKVFLEITRQGAGMIFPTMKQVYFRLYRSGHLEFETPPRFNPDAGRANFEMVEKTIRLSRDEVNELIEVAGKRDFQRAVGEYPALQTWIDAVMVTTIIYSSTDGEKMIVITNYSPKHEKARNYYPKSLKLLLQKVVALRPKTDEEREFGWDKLY